MDPDRMEIPGLVTVAALVLALIAFGIFKGCENEADARRYRAGGAYHECVTACDRGR